MNWYVIARMLGLLSLLIGGSMIFSLPWAFPLLGQVNSFETRGFWGLMGAIFCCLTLGSGLYFIGKRKHQPFLRKEAMATVGLGWCMAGILGALPFILSGAMRQKEVPMTPIDAIFEAVSGFTTTGASVMTELEDPEAIARCVMFWRCFTHWLGGMGIIVLFVAVLGQLGAQGKAMLKREVPGPINESVRPRVREAAITMWSIYVALSLLETALLWGFGVPLYHAMCHTFGTMATGGFSTFNKSAGSFGGGPVEAILVVFMILAATNFSLFDRLFRAPRRGASRLRLRGMLDDPEFRIYISILLAATLTIAVSLLRHRIYARPAAALQHSLFSVVSIMTTTGFATEDFARWPEFSKGVLLVLMFVGGCAGSTAGGIKVIRCVLIVKIVWLELERAFRPNVVRPLKLAGSVVSDQVSRDVVVYLCLIVLITVGGWLTFIAIEPDHPWSEHPRSSTAEKLLDSATAVAATLNNVGPGLGIVGPTENYSRFSPQGKLLMTLFMLLGRLELFAVIVMFSPRFWRAQ